MFKESRTPAAIVGIGYTKYSTNSGRPVLSLATEACRKAMEDAGLGKNEIDGVLTFNIGDSVSAGAVATSLALKSINYSCEWYSGGTAPSALVELAGLLVNSKKCSAVLIFRAMNGRSSFRLGGTGWENKANDIWQYRMPYGYFTPAETMAMWCRRHMITYGTTSEHLGAIAINQRSNAVINENAMKRKAITIDDYLAAKMICDPLRLLDICLESDGACAIIVTHGDRAKDCSRKPVYIKASAWVGSSEVGCDWADYFLREDMTENFAAHLGEKLYKESGLAPRDIDVAEIYDCFTHAVLMGLEGLGFCKKGEGGPFAASGAICLNGKIPVNTNGGMLSEGYIHGMNTIIEAVKQLRDDCGPLQVKGAKNAIVTSGAFTEGSGLILSSEKEG